jgi:hypothetical protein
MIFQYKLLFSADQCISFSHYQPITLKLSGKTIPNRLYRTPLSEYASTYDEDNVENCGKPLPRYAELYQGSSRLREEINVMVGL